MCDASYFAVGAVLGQRVNKKLNVTALAPLLGNFNSDSKKNGTT
jgi:hypothetical protein